MNPLYFVAIIVSILEQHNNGWHCFVVYSFHADWAVQYVTLCAVSRQGQKITTINDCMLLRKKSVFS